MQDLTRHAQHRVCLSVLDGGSIHRTALIWRPATFTCSAGSKNMWVEDNFPPMTRFRQLFHDQGAIFYRQGIERLVQRSDKCLQRLGDYVEK
ncbi:hypothetical protein AVEN_195853-1 [Araneus ventricosus]|uniref:Uncharacterized protein n=1 Tax=Araneus ventricosus TaxID=182803 RepID=A0A4Y2DWU3_ARAVE|nr:hypothetical protein AVEN_195853-1 [Araneus ventricosus]